MKIEKGKDISKVVRDKLCMGCGTCSSMCPSSSISLIMNQHYGEYRPEIKTDSCTDCGICFAVCPGHEIDIPNLSEQFLSGNFVDERIGDYLSLYIGYSCDHDLRYRCATGGMVTLTLLYMLEKELIDGALVAHMPVDGTLTPQPVIARTPEDIIASATSKYCPVPTNAAVKEILDIPGRYAVVGLPCHLHGIRKAERISKKLHRRIVLHLGLFCGSGTPFTGTEFAIYRKNLKRSEVKYVTYRGGGWPGSNTIELNSGEKIREDYYKFWDRNLSAFIPNRCRYCHDHTAELSDVSYGDAWLQEIVSEDQVGTNLMIVRNNCAADILKKMHREDRIFLAPIERQKVLESQNHCRWKKTEISARIKLASILGKRVPAFGEAIFPAPTLLLLTEAAIEYLQVVLTSRKSLWWLLRLTSCLLDKVGYKKALA
jgi:coenzyme F420 hydrogenase subunit beta